MLIHIVMLRLSPGLSQTEKETAAAKLIQMLKALELTIPELRSMEAGRNISSRPTAFDIVLRATFDDEAGLDAYRIHPEHQKVLEYIRQTVTETAVVDYFSA